MRPAAVLPLRRARPRPASATPATCAGHDVHHHAARVDGQAAGHVEPDAVDRHPALGDGAARHDGRRDVGAPLVVVHEPGPADRLLERGADGRVERRRARSRGRPPAPAGTAGGPRRTARTARARRPRPGPGRVARAAAPSLSAASTSIGGAREDGAQVRVLPAQVDAADHRSSLGKARRSSNGRIARPPLGSDRGRPDPAVPAVDRALPGRLVAAAHLRGAVPGARPAATRAPGR